LSLSVLTEHITDNRAVHEGSFFDLFPLSVLTS